MIRAFSAIALPPEIRARLAEVQAGLPEIRPVPTENLHLTLVFLGSLPEPQLGDLDMEFAGIRAPELELTLSGLGLFGGDRPHNLHATLTESAALRHLQARLETAARRIGVAPERRRFTPHVTLARLGHDRRARKCAELAVAQSADFRAGPFKVGFFGLYRSETGRNAAHYTEMSRYTLFSSQGASSGA
ncbi:RNA 2',3'-cyclic phosphodiesterase [Rhodovulum sp. MB263]|uniref:RNA 2',3'-cyclic phosphodiesterase n=1 Tax=Rhodovulum sp. (strain MB263) TaxID=308754 RepID=UPI0009B77141|nr:RNA 2',3'-cyclic phosphodiesterase [Rhodovulum sp. MB263]ARC88675.1 2'-5' RNA ligase [Rhodovulum sp. MB263]